MREHWRATLDDPAVTVEVVDGDTDALACFVAYDTTSLLHLAVLPERWGEGLGSEAVGRAVAAIRRNGERPRLRCLAENHRAAGLYAHLGWTPSGVERRASWPPHPVEREWVLAGSTS